MGELCVHHIHKPLCRLNEELDCISILYTPSLNLFLSQSIDQASLTRELRSFPLRSDTLKHKLKRSEVETKLVEVEDAIKIFSRPKVFVKVDD